MASPETLSLAERRLAQQNARRWIRLRRGVQYAALLLFVVWLVAARRAVWPPAWTTLPLRLDPLLALANFISTRAFAPLMAVALATVLLALVFGRAWCGWLCPLGTVFDLFPLRRAKRKTMGNPVPESWRGIKYILAASVLILAALGSLALLALDPLTILYRSLTVAVWPALDVVVTVLEKAALRWEWLSGPVTTLDSWLRPAVLPLEPAVYRWAWVFAAFLAGLVLLNLAAPRFWCRYLCPLGGLLGWISRLALVRREVSEGCKDCGLCTRACPTGTIQPDQGYTSDPAECTLCLECLPACSRSAIQIAPVWKRGDKLSLPKPAPGQPYDPGRRQFLAALGLSLAALAVARSSVSSKTLADHRLRPPGAIEDDLLNRCLRCGACLRACPTSGLQPALTEAGLEGVWTPVLVPRLGYCDFACTSCGQACPVQAIPRLALEDKRQQVIGKAYIDQNRCIAWSDHTDCIVCEEMCPLPEKAVYLEQVTFSSSEGEARPVKVPHVDRQRCIGCGICEYRCPVPGQAAIRVYV